MVYSYKRDPLNHKKGTSNSPHCNSHNGNKISHFENIGNEESSCDC